MNWQPSYSMQTLKHRAEFLAAIRQFFANKDVLEVDVPSLSQGTVTELHLDPLCCQFDFDVSGDAKTLYLQTSPEFAMKRLLAAGSGAIYYLGKAFRHESAGRFHNPEFTMLEWYRPGFDDKQLMAEVEQLVTALLNTPKAQYLSYQQAFEKYLNTDPIQASIAQLQALVASKTSDEWICQETNKDTLMQWLFSMFVEPELGKSEQGFRPCFVYDFPASQASLAKINVDDPRVAHRFELYFKGSELANGFYELQDAEEQRRRFDKDNELRAQNGLPQRPIDEHFMAALKSGLPSCSGVALGVDRLLMLKLGKTHIEEVLPFASERA